MGFAFASSWCDDSLCWVMFCLFGIICVVGENCIFGTLNNALHRFGISNIDFVKIGLQTLQT
jgi:hypothetical protein